MKSRQRTARIPEHVHPHRPGRPDSSRQHRLGRARDEDHGSRRSYSSCARTFPGDEATVLAAGADDVLANARVVPDVADAIADCGLVVGTTARGAASAVAHRRAARSRARNRAPQRRPATVAILFGAERTGLRQRRTAAVPHVADDSDGRRLHLAESRDGGAGSRLRGVARAARPGRRRHAQWRPRAARERRRHGEVLRALRAGARRDRFPRSHRRGSPDGAPAAPVQSHGARPERNEHPARHPHGGAGQRRRAGEPHVPRDRAARHESATRSISTTPPRRRSTRASSPR